MRNLYANFGKIRVTRKNMCLISSKSYYKALYICCILLFCIIFVSIKTKYSYERECL